MKYSDLMEDAAGGSTGAGSIAGNRGGSIFSNRTNPMKYKANIGNVQRIKFKNDSRRWVKVAQRVAPFYSFGQFLSANLGGNGSGVSESSTPNIQDVTSKLDAIGNAAKVTNDNTVQFGLEDSQGNIVKIYVDAEHADEFETALAREMDADNDMDRPEIAELLFKLKSDFNIKNVVWPKIQDDAIEEEEASVDQIQDANTDLALGADMEGGDGMSQNGDGNIDVNQLPAQDGVPGSTGGSPAEDALASIIQLLGADAEAKKAEADARQAEARAREAEAMQKTAELKIKSEEQILDMEAYNKKESQERGETRKLAKLAKYRHDLKRAAEGEMQIQHDLKDPASEKTVDIDIDAKTSEEEERTNKPGTSISLDTLIKIVTQLQSRESSQE